MVVGWYHSHPGFGCWLSGVDINTQQVTEVTFLGCPNHGNLEIIVWSYVSVAQGSKILYHVIVAYRRTALYQYQ